jgi:hypothetical protein
MKQMADRERRMERKARLASAAIELGVGWPVNHLAWLKLADWYNARAAFDRFWEQAVDRCGRLELYRRWRRGKG